jgi:prepilin-type N-terminal cleavage/methylation domain-containing protein
MISPRPCRENHENRTVRPGQDGFTLIELIVALGVTTIVMLGILFLFDFNNRLTRVQTNVADMQQSLRIAQYDMVRMVRMAGRGGLNALQGIVINRDVDDGTHVGDPDSPIVLEGTDVLTLRGVFTTPVYQIAYTNPASFHLDEDADPANFTGGGYVDICKLSPSGAEQDLDVLIQTERLSKPEVLVLVSPLDDRFYVAVELDPNTTSDTTIDTPTSCPTAEGIRVGFNIVNTYSALSAPPAQALVAFSKVGYVGFLEEYRFYVREDHSVAGNVVSDLMPVLSRARFYPGTDNPYGDPAAPPAELRQALRQDISDGILDLQISEGFDTNGDGTLVENIEEPDTDEWLGNADAEPAINGRLKALRITTLARTNRMDHDYRAEDLTVVEDHPYTLADDDRVNGKQARMYRRRILQTIVNVRNLTS